MGIKIASNIPSIQVQRSLRTSSDKLASIFERLSSGQRINKPSDDSAGLAVAASLYTDSRVYNQGFRNLNDGISLLNIADSALDSLSNIVIRIQELAEQSANSVLGAEQRESIDAEAQALSKEYFRISRTTEFNDMGLLDGTVQGLSLQAGYGSDGSILSSLGGALGDGTFASVSTQYTTEVTESYDIALSDLNVDGILDMVTAGPTYTTVRMGIGDGTFSTYSTRYITQNYSMALELADLNQDGVMDVVTAGSVVGSGNATVRLGTGDGTFSSSKTQYTTESGDSMALALSDLNGDGILDMVTAGEDSGTIGQATVRLGVGDGTFSSGTQYVTEVDGVSRAVALADLNGDGAVDMVTGGDYGTTIRLGKGDGTFSSSTSMTSEGRAIALSDLNGDGILDMVANGSSAVQVYLGKGDGTFSSTGTQYSNESSWSSALELSDLNGDGILDMITAGCDSGVGKATIRLGTGGGTFSSSTIQYTTETQESYAIALGDINRDGVQDLVTAGTNSLGGGAKATTRLANTQDGVAPILPFSLSTMAEARQAIPILEQKLEQLDTQRGVIGAFESRVLHSLRALQASSENVAAAASRITDADIAEDSAALVSTQVLQKAGVAVLAQANQQPSVALTLLAEVSGT